jgi:hypothetical protein
MIVMPSYYSSTAACPLQKTYGITDLRKKSPKIGAAIGTFPYQSISTRIVMMGRGRCGILF